MPNESQHLANAIAATTNNATSDILAAAATKAPRPRSLSEILDVSASFVTGYPQPVETANGRND